MTHDHPAPNPQSRLAAAVAATLEERMLLTHPFYRRWEAGELRTQELAEYAVHYRAFEAVLPTVLSAVVDRLMADGQLEAADLVARNLADELGRPESHLTCSTSSPPPCRPPTRSAPGPAADALAGTYRELAEQSPVAAIAGLAAYETQAAAIAASKGDGLRRWYGMDADGTSLLGRPRHDGRRPRRLGRRGPGRAGRRRAEVGDAARRAADAWWALLDEREAEGLATV